MRPLVAFFIVLWSGLALAAHDGPSTFTLTPSAPQIPPQGEIQIALQWSIPPGWHMHGPVEAFFASPPQLLWTLPQGLRVKDIQWGPTTEFNEGKLTLQGYADKATALVTLERDGPYDLTNARISLKALWVLCNVTCLRQEQTLELTFPAATYLTAAQMAEVTQSLAPKQPLHAGLWAMLLAFIGGVLLNLMPCVLPVLSLKLMDLFKVAKHPGQARLLGFSYTLGVLTTFWLLAAMLLLIKVQAQAALGWGFQLQSPLFVWGMALVMLLLALNLFGFFEVGTFLTRFDVQAGPPWLRTYLGGMLACVVATPCSAPFMGSALAYALSTTPGEAMAVFTALGLGLALPFLLITNIPALLRKLPKPGMWMVKLRRILGGMLALTTLWLMWVLHGLVEEPFFVLGILALVAIGGGIALYTQRHTQTPFKVGGFLALFVSIGVVLYTLKHGEGDDMWESFTPAKLQAYRQQGRPVFIDFTARWCLMCQTNKTTILNTSKVLAHFKKHQVALLRADWTRYDPAITQALATYGRQSIPLNVYYPAAADAQPLILPAVLTQDTILHAIK